MIRSKLFVLFFTFIFFQSCTHLFFQPDSDLYIDKSKVTEKLTEKMHQSQNGKISEWLFEPKNKKEKKVHILFFHGNAENVSAHFLALHWILSEGYSYSIFDYPGYGSSEGSANQKTATDSGRFMIQKMKQDYPNSKIIIFGQSLGGNIAAYSAAEEYDSQICALVLDSTFSSYKEEARSVLSQSWITWLIQPLSYILVSNEYSTNQNLQKLNKIPKLFFHGTEDQVVDYKLGLDFFNLVPEPKEFFSVKKAKHVQTFHDEDYKSTRRKFLDFISKNCE